MRHIVNALLLRNGTEILLARRAAHRKAYGGLWSFPGGHVEAGETLEDALVRETSEEIGVVPVIYTAVARIPDPNALSDPAEYHMYVVPLGRRRARHTRRRALGVAMVSASDCRNSPRPCP